MRICLWTLSAFIAALIVGDIGSAYSAETGPELKAISEVGELGENIYDLAKEKDWDKTAKKLAALKHESDSLNTVLKDAAGTKAELAKRIAALVKSVPAKDQQTTMREGNRIMLLAAEMSEPFHPQIPVDITRLDFYGNELEIWSAAKNDAKLTTSAAALQKVWTKVRPSVVEHGGRAEAEKFDSLIERLKRAKSPEEFKAVATPILDEVDNLEKVFSK